MRAIAVPLQMAAPGIYLRNFSLTGAWSYVQWTLLAAALCVAVSIGSTPDVDESKVTRTHASAPQSVEIVRSLVWR